VPLVEDDPNIAPEGAGAAVCDVFPNVNPVDDVGADVMVLAEPKPVVTEPKPGVDVGGFPVPKPDDGVAFATPNPVVIFVPAEAPNPMFVVGAGAVGPKPLLDAGAVALVEPNPTDGAGVVKLLDPKLVLGAGADAFVDPKPAVGAGIVAPNPVAEEGVAFPKVKLPFVFVAGSVEPDPKVNEDVVLEVFVASSDEEVSAFGAAPKLKVVAGGICVEDSLLIGKDGAGGGAGVLVLELPN